jgi:hypothetical protein
MDPPGSAFPTLTQLIAQTTMMVTGYLTFSHMLNLLRFRTQTRVESWNFLKLDTVGNRVLFDLHYLADLGSGVERPGLEFLRKQAVELETSSK